VPWGRPKKRARLISKSRGQVTSLQGRVRKGPQTNDKEEAEAEERAPLVAGFMSGLGASYERLADVKLLEKAWTGNSAPLIEQALDWEPWRWAAAVALMDAIDGALLSGVEVGIRFSPRGFTVPTVPEIKSAADGWAKAHAAARIKHLERGSRMAIRVAIHNHLRLGTSPAQAAREVAEVIGLDMRQAKALNAFRRRLELSGASQQSINAQVAEYRRRSILVRAKRIADTEISQALNQGERILWEEAGSQGLVDLKQVTKTWRLNSGNPCVRCIDLNGTTIGFQELFVTAVPPGFVGQGPTVHPSCYCFLEYANASG
jgi:hypothetical protein